ncbi:hypothetical protein CC80DRAFT_462985 [Byssothecium circinans]|uniref:Uncharacterized protein n=1 Tax=Byssothecium circinans TaxID=147558 RepID=A0A6A5UBE5_9PLEO|nr:hypothetical protein CC80DRAFT_462985 [Byssothecium circinans]
MENTRKGPFHLVTFNTAPDRAKRLIGRMIERLNDRYEIIHVYNCEFASTVRQHQPNLLFSASMWTPEQAQEIREIAQRERAGIKTHAIPEGLQVQRGSDAILEYLLEKIPPLLDSVEL